MKCFDTVTEGVVQIVYKVVTVVFQCKWRHKVSGGVCVFVLPLSQVHIQTSDVTWWTGILPNNYNHRLYCLQCEWGIMDTPNLRRYEASFEAFPLLVTVVILPVVWLEHWGVITEHVPNLKHLECAKQNI